ncbi:MAG TPA: aminodeoxychorismate/anthranilate synthase component II [Fibrobacteria bacterium]|nr:aminodeoxychorismate/anthranilate synthase component II [Fibrobacteria bacterium]HOX52840.1 aminodeoxychorismate/anthranilate synthase component II [Fibrobacteria bacterium]
MILVLDNYDSFTFNLVQYLGELLSGRDSIEVVRNDACTAQQILSMGPSHIVVSPGPCSPSEAGISVELIERCPSSIPLLGVCLGHQAIGQAMGAVVERSPIPMHGKVSEIHHDRSLLFKDLPDPFEATRYHSLIVRREDLPPCLRVTAWTSDGLIMGMEHVSRPVYGVQFHPESIRTSHGKQILSNFLSAKGL